MPGHAIDRPHAIDHGIDRKPPYFRHQFFRGESERRWIDLEVSHLIQGRDRRRAGTALTLKKGDFADHFTTPQIRQRTLAFFDLDLARENEAKRLARLTIAHDHRSRRQFAPCREPQQLPDIDIVELAQHGQAAHRLPARFVGDERVFLENLEAHRRQILGHVGTQAITGVQILLERARDDLVGLFRNVRVELCHHNRFGVDDLVDQRRRIRPAERQAAGEQLVEHHAQGIQVSLVIQCIALDLLRAHVGRRAQTIDEGRIDVDVLANVECQAEIHQLDLVFLGKHDIGRLDVAVHDAAPMRVIERHRDLEYDAHHAMHGQQPVHGHELVKACAFDQFHHQIRALFLDLPVIHARDVRMIELRGNRSFGGEKLAEPA